MTKKKNSPSPTLSQKIKEHIKGKNNEVIDFLKEQSRCSHVDWERQPRGYKCAMCDYYSGNDVKLNQLINKLTKK